MGHWDAAKPRWLLRPLPTSHCPSEGALYRPHLPEPWDQRSCCLTAHQPPHSAQPAPQGSGLRAQSSPLPRWAHCPEPHISYPQLSPQGSMPGMPPQLPPQQVKSSRSAGWDHCIIVRTPRKQGPPEVVNPPNAAPKWGSVHCHAWWGKYLVNETMNFGQTHPVQ